MNVIFDIRSFILRCGTKNSKFVKRANIFECIAILRNEVDIELAASRYRLKWGDSTVHLRDDKRFLHTFGLKLQLWKIKIRSNGNVESDRVFGNSSDDITMNILVPDTWDCEYLTDACDTRLVLNTDVLNFLPCGDPDCSFVTFTQFQLKRHRAAHEKERVLCQQKIMGQDVFIDRKLAENGFLPPKFFQKYFCCWDIETLAVLQDGKRVHKPISIGVTRNFGQKKEFFFYRKSMESSELQKMVAEFVKLLREFSVEYRTLSEMKIIQSAVEEIRLKFWKHKHTDKKLSPAESAAYSKYHKYMVDCLKLKIYTFNGER